MATRKAAKKSTKKSDKKPTKAKPTKKPKPKPRPKAFVPGNDPIIVGGGSVFLDFDRRFRGVSHPNPGKQKFQDPTVGLVQVVVIRAGVVIHRHPLDPTDRVVVCYTGSTCP